MFPSLTDLLQDFPAQSPTADQVEWLRGKLITFHEEVATRVAALEARQDDVERRVTQHEERLAEQGRRIDLLERKVEAARRGELDVALLEAIDPDLATRH